MSGVPAPVSCSGAWRGEGRSGTCGEADIYFDLSKGRYKRYKQEELLLFWPECAYFVLTGEPDQEEERRGEKREAERK